MKHKYIFKGIPSIQVNSIEAANFGFFRLAFAQNIFPKTVASVMIPLPLLPHFSSPPLAFSHLINGKFTFSQCVLHFSPCFFQPSALWFYFFPILQAKSRWLLFAKKMQIFCLFIFGIRIFLPRLFLILFGINVVYYIVFLK